MAESQRKLDGEKHTLRKLKDSLIPIFTLKMPECNAAAHLEFIIKKHQKELSLEEFYKKKTRFLLSKQLDSVFEEKNERLMKTIENRTSLLRQVLANDALKVNIEKIEDDVRALSQEGNRHKLPTKTRVILRNAKSKINPLLFSNYAGLIRSVREGRSYSRDKEVIRVTTLKDDTDIFSTA